MWLIKLSLPFIIGQGNVLNTIDQAGSISNGQHDGLFLPWGSRRNTMSARIMELENQLPRTQIPENANHGHQEISPAPTTEQGQSRARVDTSIQQNPNPTASAEATQSRQPCKISRWMSNVKRKSTDSSRNETTVPCARGRRHSTRNTERLGSTAPAAPNSSRINFAEERQIYHGDDGVVQHQHEESANPFKPKVEEEQAYTEEQDFTHIPAETERNPTPRSQPTVATQGGPSTRAGPSRSTNIEDSFLGNLAGKEGRTSRGDLMHLCNDLGHDEFRRLRDRFYRGEQVEQVEEVQEAEGSDEQPPFLVEDINPERRLSIISRTSNASGIPPSARQSSSGSTGTRIEPSDTPTDPSVDEEVPRLTLGEIRDFTTQILRGISIIIAESRVSAQMTDFQLQQILALLNRLAYEVEE
ncbi:uncharacterized protein LY89DRAFT_756713 [Mollisia scopiformis]|uniref:Uncharacterized protein n=1 Tax=Mollisia scopiformis TaxID=149040 RepID=A0A194WWK6_MOLSC|nr:uncharacterized protein LY89DRAFT_756713 [Mollisia scopiformis]KUJ12330.1 hypothetical protein LY89DRAFT_756713 [Mollisia scopiformis]